MLSTRRLSAIFLLASVASASASPISHVGNDGQVYYLAEPIFQQVGGDGTLSGGTNLQYVWDLGPITGSNPISATFQFFNNAPASPYSENLDYGTAIVTPWAMISSNFAYGQVLPQLHSPSFTITIDPTTWNGAPFELQFGVDSDGHGINFLGVTRLGFVDLTVTTGVPELSTWAMLLLGFCGMGFLAYQRENRPAARAA